MTKKSSESKINAVFNRVFKIREWGDWDRVKTGALSMSSLLLDLFKPSPVKSPETFLDAQQRLKLSDDRIMAQGKALFRLSLIMLFFAIFFLGYDLYLWVTGAIFSAIFTGVLFFLSLSLAFRYHFWYFQIKVKKLGCSVQEWFEQGLMRKKP